MKKIAWIFAALTLGAVACTKQPSPVEVPPGSLYRTGAEEVPVVDVVVELPAKYKNRISPLDRVLWDVKDARGTVVAAGLVVAEKFPFKIQVTSKKLTAPLDPKSGLLVSARVVKAGDENRPPQKGQLQGFLGVAANEMKAVVVPKVKPSLLAKAEQKFGWSDNFKPVNVGSVAKLVLEPSVF
ncbi:MAG: hypothetical protein HUU37_10460 [Bdellovibrionales bacterium]|nr:hypothetical protein [Bdellovibrionales bacterium]